MIRMTSSRSSRLAGPQAGPGHRLAARRHQAAFGARIGRAGIDRLAFEHAQQLGQVKRPAGRREERQCLAGTARLDQRLGARCRRPAGHRPSPRRPRASRLRIGPVAVSFLRSNVWTNSSPWPPAMAAATLPSPGGAEAASSARMFMPASGTLQPIAMPCAAAMPTRRPVKLPGPTPTRMRVGTWPSSISSIIGTSRSAWPRPITSSRDATIVPSRQQQRGGAGGGRRVEREDQRLSLQLPWRHGGTGSAYRARKKRKRIKTRPLRSFRPRGHNV